MLVIVAAFLLLAAGRSDAAGAPAPDAVCPVRSYNFGTVKQGDKVSHCFAVRNDGNAALTTTGMQLPSPEVIARAPAAIAPGKTGEVCVDLDTSTMSRAVHTWVIIDSNDPTVPRLPLYLNGSVSAPIDLLPYATVFASLFKGEGATRGVIVVNNQKAPLRILGFATAGPQHFKTSVKVHKPGRIYEVTIEIPPTLPPGQYHESTYLKTDSPQRSRLRIGVDLLIKDEIYAFPAALNFGPVRIPPNAADGPAGPATLTASFLVKKRAGRFRLTAIKCDVAGLQLTQTPRDDSDTYRFDLVLPENRLKTGPLNGSIRLHTDDQAVPQIVVPITGEIQ